METSTGESVSLGNELMMDNSSEMEMTKAPASPVTGHSGGETPNLQTGIDDAAPRAPANNLLGKKPDLNSNEDKAMDDFQSLNFPNKLWKMIESDDFNSVWWHHDGNVIVIDRLLFKGEVLGREGSSKIFETSKMKSFIRQLNLYGFIKVQMEFERSPSLPAFLAEKEMAAAFEKLQFYQNPNFRRGQPALLVRMKRKRGVKRALSYTSTSEGDRRDNHKRRKCDEI